MLAILSCGVLLSLPALVNGYPLVFPDSGTYVRQAIALSGEYLRHPYYSLFLLPFHMRVSLWPIVFMQSIVASIFLFLVVKVIEDRRPLLFLIALTALLSLLTGLPWFSSEIMPDVFTGLVVLSVFLLAFAWDRLRPGGRWFVVLALTVMLTFHPTFPPLTILLGGFVLAVQLFRRVPRRRILRIQAVLLGPAALALSAMVLYSVALIHQATILPWASSLMLARVIADGPGRAYLCESCRAGAAYELCAYVDELPSDENVFLFANDSPWLKVTQKLGIDATRAEASNIVVNTIRQYPLWEVKQSLIGFGNQLVMFRGIEPPLCPATDTGPQLKACLDGFQITKVVARYFPDELNEFMGSLQNRNRLPLGIIYFTDIAVVIVSAACCVLLLFRWRRSDRRPEPLFGDLFVVILVGIVTNAALTGILSMPQHRYEGRVIWLLPFFVALYFGRSTGARR
jgi:hypothetical protein